MEGDPKPKQKQRENNQQNSFAEMEGDPKPKQKWRENNQQNSLAEIQKQYLQDSNNTFKWIAGLKGQQWWTVAAAKGTGVRRRDVWSANGSGVHGRQRQAWGEEKRLEFGLWTAVVEKWGARAGLGRNVVVWPKTSARPKNERAGTKTVPTHTFPPFPFFATKSLII
jgi:hypothetical protein